MAKINIKFGKIIPFGGIFQVRELYLMLCLRLLPKKKQRRPIIKVFIFHIFEF